MEDNRINRFICKYAGAKEIVFKKCFIGMYFNFRNPLIGLAIGFSIIELNILCLNITIALKIE